MNISGYQLHDAHVASNANIRFAIVTSPSSLHLAYVMYGFQCNIMSILAHMRNMHDIPTNVDKLKQNVLKLANVHLME